MGKSINILREWTMDQIQPQRLMSLISEVIIFIVTVKMNQNNYKE